MASIAIQITRSQADDLSAVCALGEERLRGVAAAIGSAPATISQDRIRGTVREAVGDDPAADRLSTVIFGLSALKTRDAHSSADIIAGISRTLAKEFAGDETVKSWPDVRNAVQCILDCESIYLAAKAVDISYDFERLFVSARVMTSVRPVFNDAREQIVGSAIVQSLRIEYVSLSGDRQNISIGLDVADVQSLAKACDDALRKARVAKDELSKTWSENIISMGTGV